MAKMRKISGIFVPIQLDTSAVERDLQSLNSRIGSFADKMQKSFDGALNSKKMVDGIVQVNRALGQLRDSADAVGKMSGFGEFEKSLRIMRPALKELAQQFGGTVEQQREMYRAMASTQAIQQEVTALNSLSKALGLSKSATLDFANARGRMVSQEAAVKFLDVGKLTQTESALTKLNRQFVELSRTSGSALTADTYRKFSDSSAIQKAVSAFERLNNGQKITAANYEQIARAAKVSSDAVAAYVTQSEKVTKTSRGWTGVFTPGNVAAGAQSAMASLGVVGGMYGITELGKAMYQASLKMENLQLAFESIYNSSSRATAQLNFVKDIADQLGLSFLVSAEGAKKLFAAARGTELEKDANQILKAFSTMSAALKLSGEETDSVFLAVSQIISKGKVSAEELRLQLSERMPGAVTLFAKSIGVTTKELDAMLQKGEVGLDSLKKFAVEVEKTYTAGAASAASGLQAEMNRVANEWFRFKEAFVDTGESAKALRGITSSLKTMTEYAPDIASFLTLLGKFGLVAGSAALLGKAISGIVGAVKALQAAMTGGLIASLGTPAAPIAAAALAIGAIGTAVWETSSRMTEGEKVLEKYSDKLYDISKNSEKAAERQGTLNQQVMENQRLAATVALKKAQKEFKAFTEGTSTLEYEGGSGTYYALTEKSTFEKQIEGLLKTYGAGSPQREALLKQGRDIGLTFFKSISEGMAKGMPEEEFRNLFNLFKNESNAITSQLLTTGEGSEQLAEAFITLMSASAAATDTLDTATRATKDFGDGSASTVSNVKAFTDTFENLKKATQDTDLGKNLKFNDEVSAMAQNLIKLSASSDQAAEHLFGVENAAMESSSTLNFATTSSTDLEQAFILVGQAAIKNKADLTVLNEAIRVAGEKAQLTTKQIADLQDRLKAGFQVGGIKAADEIIADLRVEQKVTKLTAGGKKAFNVLKSYATDTAGQLQIASALASGSLTDIEKAFKNTALSSEQALRIIDEAKKTASVVDVSKGAKSSTQAYEKLNSVIEATKNKIDEWRAKNDDSKVDSFTVTMTKELEKIDKALRTSKASEIQKNQLRELRVELEAVGREREKQIALDEAQKAREAFTKDQRRVTSAYKKVVGVDNTEVYDAAKAQYDIDAINFKDALDKKVISQQEYASMIMMLDENLADAKLRSQTDLFSRMQVSIDEYYKKYGDFTTGIGNVLTTAMNATASAAAAFAVSGARDFNSLADAFDQMAQRILSTVAELLAQQVVASMFKSLGSIFSGGSSFGGFSSGVSAGAGWIGGSANGNAFAGISGYSNSIVSTPTLFSNAGKIPAYASGVGLMGEAGPEAVMPLVRTSSGKLGVRSEGGYGLNQVINVNVMNNTDSRVTTRESKDEQGNVNLEVMIDQQNALLMRKPGSASFRALQSFGAAPSLANR